MKDDKKEIRESVFTFRQINLANVATVVLLAQFQLCRFLSRALVLRLSWMELDLNYDTFDWQFQFKRRSSS